MRIPERPPVIKNRFNNQKVRDELLALNKLDLIFSKNEHSYPYWDKWKWLAQDWKYDPIKLWSFVKSERRTHTVFHFTNILGFDFHLNTPSIIQKYLHELDLNLGGSLQSQALIPREQKQTYLVSSLMEEAIASSQLEGAVTTRKIAKEMLENSRKPRTNGEQMIVNNYEAMKWIVANKEIQITPERIRLVHDLLTRSTLDREDVGAFRKDDRVNVVDAQTGKIIYSPPSHVHIPKLIDRFCMVANDQENAPFFIHPILKAIILHFLIGYIHPFANGNGRTARTLFYWYLLKKQYWLIEYMSVSRVILNSKAQYAQAYLHTELDENDLTYFLIYNSKAIQTALADLKSYIARKNEERRNALSLLKNTSFNDRQISLINELLQDPGLSFTVVQVQTRMAVSNQTARNDLSELVRRGVLETRKSGKLAQFFAAKGFEKKLLK